MIYFHQPNVTSYPYGLGHFKPYRTPHPAYANYNRMRRGPTRLIWFCLGGLVTYLAISLRERKHQAIRPVEEKPAERNRMGGWGRGWGNSGDHQAQTQRQQQMKEYQRRARDLRQSFSEAVSTFVHRHNTAF